MAIDDWGEGPSEGVWPKWFGGVAAPVLIAAYAASIFISGQGMLIGRSRRVEVYGPQAWALSAAWLGLSVFLHAHYFWGIVDGLAPYSPLGKIVGLIALISGVGWLFVKILVMG